MTKKKLQINYKNENYWNMWITAIMLIPIIITIIIFGSTYIKAVEKNIQLLFLATLIPAILMFVMLIYCGSKRRNRRKKNLNIIKTGKHISGYCVGARINTDNTETIKYTNSAVVTFLDDGQERTVVVDNLVKNIERKQGKWRNFIVDIYKLNDDYYIDVLTKYKNICY